MSPACRGPMVAKPPVEHRANVSRTMPRARGNDNTRHIETARIDERRSHTPRINERRSHTPRIEAPRDKTPRRACELRGVDASTDASVSYDACAGRCHRRR